MCAWCDVIMTSVCHLLRPCSLTFQPFCYGVGWRFGTWSAACVNPGVKINEKYYRETLLKEELIPDMRDVPEYFVFQQDSAPAHRVKEVDLLLKETPPFTPFTTLWPSNSPDVVDFKVCSLLWSKCTKWRSTMLMSYASIYRLSGMNLTSMTRRLSSGAPA